jgi:hypothetical protein
MLSDEEKFRRAAIDPVGASHHRRDLRQPVAGRPAHHRAVGVDLGAGAIFPQAGVGLVVVVMVIVLVTAVAAPIE